MNCPFLKQNSDIFISSVPMAQRFLPNLQKVRNAMDICSLKSWISVSTNAKGTLRVHELLAWYNYCKTIEAEAILKT